MDEQAVTSRRVGTIQIGDKSLTLSALGLKDYASGRTEALRRYKREMIETWTQNADLLPEDVRADFVRDAFRRAETITIDSLPRKKMKMPRRGPDGSFVSSNGTPELIDQEVEYEFWWWSETPEGKLFMTWLSARRASPSLTIDDVDELFINAAEKLEEAAQQIGDLSESELLKNSDAPPPPPSGPEGKKERRRRRRQRTAAAGS